MIRLTSDSNGIYLNRNRYLDTPVLIATQNELETKLPINNPNFTGKLIGTSVELENITINGITSINMLLCKFKKVNTNNDYPIENTYTNITICGEDADIVHLPLEPIDGMTINIRNLSEKI